MATTTGGTRAGNSQPASIQLPGVVLGVGMGGFVDGILLHQLLRWHHMLSSTNQDRIGVKYYNPHTVSGLEMNTLWDGIFHTVCWISVLLGLAILYSRVTHNRLRVWTSRVLWGWMLVGWGLFNLVEGVLDHEILGIHHVYAGDDQVWWDIGFLVLGALLVAGGYLLQRGGRPFDSHAPAAGGEGRRS
ncbi:membrane protein [Streptomyces platensis subsp. clarensis]|nr:membrane protein [Streptomyces platensis subsp. clarensis]